VLYKSRSKSKLERDGARKFLHDIWQPLTLLIVTSVSMASFFPLQNPRASTNSPFFCNADGNLKMQTRNGRSYEPLWDPALFFIINITYGELSFTTAKVIDACWDAVIGRGGQMLVAVLAYRVLRRSFTLTGEGNTIPIATITSLYCHRIQIGTTWDLTRTVCLCRGKMHPIPTGILLSSKIRLLAQILVCLYVLAFATLVSVMTGYRAELTGVFDHHETNSTILKPFDGIYRSRMILYDGGRIGLLSNPMGCRGVFDEDDQDGNLDISAYLSLSGNVTF
jgi:hypothetical protein